MGNTIPRELQGAKYISLTTFRRTGAPVATPVWFGEHEGKLYLFTNPSSGKVKRIRHNPHVRVASCTFRGRVTGPEFEGKASILSAEKSEFARRLLKQKYWLMRVPFLWRKSSIFLEVEFS